MIVIRYLSYHHWQKEISLQGLWLQARNSGLILWRLVYSFLAHEKKEKWNRQLAYLYATCGKWKRGGRDWCSYCCSSSKSLQRYNDLSLYMYFESLCLMAHPNPNPPFTKWRVRSDNHSPGNHHPVTVTQYPFPKSHQASALVEFLFYKNSLSLPNLLSFLLILVQGFYAQQWRFVWARVFASWKLHTWPLLLCSHFREFLYTHLEREICFSLRAVLETVVKKSDVRL